MLTALERAYFGEHHAKAPQGEEKQETSIKRGWRRKKT